MRIVNFGTFLLPVRFSLQDMMRPGGREKLAERLRAGLPEFRSDAAVDADDLFFDVVGSVYQRMETMVFSGVAEIEGAGLVRLYVSSLAIAFVVIEMDLPDDMQLDLDDDENCNRFKAFETPITEIVEPLITRWSDQVVVAADPSIVRPLPPSAMVSGKLLWWHRICVDAPLGVEFPNARWYGVPVDLAHNALVHVGTGMTNVWTAGRPALVNEVVEGLMVATQEWIVVDEAKRHIADHLVRLSDADARSLITVDAQYLDVLSLTEDVTMRNLLLGQEARYLTTARLRVRQAASQAWATTAEAETLEERTAALRDLFSLHRERIFNNRDDRRNRLLFVFTAVTLIQSILVWYDFLTEPNNTTSATPRPEIAIIVLLLTVAAVVGAVLTRKHSKRSARARVPRQRTSSRVPIPEKKKA
ncbi:MAG: hypothetical protein HOV79_14730 [Hamadaea sp.]|nr:hypothetical protein [Hamadaea sp.]